MKKKTFFSKAVHFTDNITLPLTLYDIKTIAQYIILQVLLKMLQIYLNIYVHMPIKFCNFMKKIFH